MKQTGSPAPTPFSLPFLSWAWKWCGILAAVFLLVLLFLEMAAGTIFRWRYFRTRTDAQETFGPNSWVHNVPWGLAYLNERALSDRLQWTPYRYWRRHPFRGEFITISPAGRRSHSREETLPGTGSPVVWVFGGSTVWGSLVHDADTIPARLSVRLRSHPGWENCVVENYGETGYCSTQELLYYYLEIRAGRSPDLVVFCDGFNDVFSAWQNREAGIPQNEINRVLDFNRDPGKAWQFQGHQGIFSLGRVLKSWLGDLRYVVQASNLSRLLVGEISCPDIPTWQQASSYPGNPAPAQPQPLAAQVASYYLSNLRQAQVTAPVRLLAVLQPVCWESGFTPDVTARYFPNLNPDLQTFGRTCYDEIRRSVGAAPGLNFLDLSRMLAGQQKRFRDGMHYDEAGNDAIATCLASRLREFLPSPPQPSSRIQRGSSSPPEASARILETTLAGENSGKQMPGPGVRR